MVVPTITGRSGKGTITGDRDCVGAAVTAEEGEVDALGLPPDEALRVVGPQLATTLARRRLKTAARRIVELLT